ncbi:hypothetical protein GUJ93_ZPchr0012g21106 [Zizania palustris]|uniref:NAC domain-containing protein n=1 Tax=Zizania palustris TaxID=103762 RepID=A0A8J5WP94_ZIZPA|nr:hypothetical protein GUJ93_ZPchr0012g21106 [Zizania palustris]
MAEDGDLKSWSSSNKDVHFVPGGVKFRPTDLDFLTILNLLLDGRTSLPGRLSVIFHEIRVLEFHPALLYETYAKDKEDGYIYFFSSRELRRAVWVGNGAGAWKVTGNNAKTVYDDDVDVVQKRNFVFYQCRFDGDKEPIRTNWAMHEFTRIIGSQDRVADLAVYRLYKEPEAGDAAPSMDEPSAAAPPQGMAGGTMDQENVGFTSQKWHQYAYGSAASPWSSSWAAWAPPSAPGLSSWAPPTAPDSWAPLPQITTSLPEQNAPGHNTWQAAYVELTNNQLGPPVIEDGTAAPMMIEDNSGGGDNASDAGDGSGGHRPCKIQRTN